MAYFRNITPAQGARYYQRDDYYARVETPLRWGGTDFAKKLGMTGVASADEFTRALNGEFGRGTFHAKLPAPKNGADRRAGTDYEFSAPKSLSVAALVHGDTVLIEAHERAAERAMQYAASLVGCRVKGEFVQTGKCLFAATTHLTSRDEAPQLHTHGVFLNVTEGKDGQLRSAQFDMLVANRMSIELAYQTGLAYELKQLGREFNWIDNGQGHGHAELLSVSEAECKALSKGSARIDAELERMGVDPEKASYKQRDIANRNTRKSKGHLDLAEARVEWAGIAKEASEHALEPNRKPTRTKLSTPRELVDSALAQVFERESSAGAGRVLEIALRASKGQVNPELILKEFKNHPEIVQKDPVRVRHGKTFVWEPRITTRTALERERTAISLEKAGRGRVEPIMSRAEALDFVEKRAADLNEGQKRAVVDILSSSNRFIGVQGDAGVGKTTALRAVVEAMHQKSLHVTFLAPTHAAVEAGAETGADKSSTLQSFLAGRQTLDAGTVVILDESSLASGRDLVQLMKIVERDKARMPAVGDRQQLESVEASGVFALLQKSGMSTSHIDEMVRQNAAPELIREATRMSAQDASKALQMLDTHTTEIADPQARHATIADKFCNLSPEERSKTLIVSGENVDRRDINEKIRVGLGLSGVGQEYNTFISHSLTKAQVARLDGISEGDVIKFNSKQKKLGIERGEIVTVTKIDHETGILTCKTHEGRVFEYTPREESRIDVGRSERREFSPGDRVVITQREPNGEHKSRTATVVELHPDYVLVEDKGHKWRVGVKNGHLGLDHGYCVTAHKSQGLTYDRVIVDLKSTSPTVTREAVYVAITRTRHDVAVLTDDKARLLEAAGRSGAKDHALEIDKNVDKSNEKVYSNTTHKERVEDDFSLSL